MYKPLHAAVRSRCTIVALPSLVIVLTCQVRHHVLHVTPPSGAHLMAESEEEKGWRAGVESCHTVKPEYSKASSLSFSQTTTL